MYCKKCGKEIREGAKFCGSCGAKIEILSSNQAQSVQATENSNTKKAVVNKTAYTGNVDVTSNNKSNTGKLAIIIALVIVLIIVVVVAILTVSKNKDSADSQIVESSTETISDSLDEKTESESNEEDLVEEKETEEEAVKETSEEKNSDTDLNDDAVENAMQNATADSITIVSESSSSSDVVAYYAFYGVWVGGFKTMEEAQALATNLKSTTTLTGIRVVLSSEWDNLNPEPYYCVTAGSYPTKESAEIGLSVVKGAGYDGAYVKFSGDFKIQWVEEY